MERLDGDMEANNREVNSKGHQTDYVSEIVRDVIDYPDDEIKAANRDANSEVHQTQPVSGIVRDAVRPLEPLTRQTNSNNSQNGKSLCPNINDLANRDGVP